VTHEEYTLMSTTQVTAVGGRWPSEKSDPPEHVRQVIEALDAPEMEVLPALLDARGYKRGLATLPGFHKGRIPKSKGRTYPPDPPTVEEIVAVVNACHETPAGRRTRAIIILLWRAGLRISEALALIDSDLDRREGSVLVRHGKGDKRRIVAMDDWAWDRLQPWLEERRHYPAGPVFCVVAGPTAGVRSWSDTDVRRALHTAARDAGVRKRFAPHQLRHCLACELWRSGVDLLAIQRQLGHARLDVTQLYLRSVAPMEALKEIRDRPAPVMGLPTF
jgi:site-specific recombinase XerD